MNMPMVPGGLPWIGQVLEMIRMSPWDLMVHWMAKLGAIYRFQLFGESCVVVADPALLKEVLHTSVQSFRKDIDFTYKPFMVLLGTGLVTSEGSLWLKQRALVSSVLKTEILEIIPEIAKRAVERLIRKLQRLRGTNETIEMAEQFRHLTLQVIAEAILSLSAQESDQTFAKMYLPIVTEGNLRTWYPHRCYLPSKANLDFQRRVRVLNRFITDMIERRWRLRREEHASGKAKARKDDILDRILSAVEVRHWGRKAVRQLRDEIKTFILAGHETSASMLTWALYELLENEELMGKVKTEAEEVYGRPDGESRPLPSGQKLHGLIFTQCCLKEALRKYSVVPVVTREASKDVVLGGKYYVPRGTRLMILIQGVHHREDLWPRPHLYQPERFLKTPEPFTFLPFIDGPRNCIGQHLALLEAKVVMSTLVHRMDMELVRECGEGRGGRKHPWMVPVTPDDPGLLIRVR